MSAIVYIRRAAYVRILVVWALAGALVHGCSLPVMVAFNPISYPSIDKIDREIDLVLPDSFQSFEVTICPDPQGLPPNYRLLLGHALCQHARQLVEVAFRKATVADGNQVPQAGTYPVLEPVSWSIYHIPPAAKFTDTYMTAEICWVLKDTGGRIIWKDSIVGEEHWKSGYGFSSIKEMVQGAIANLFLNTYDALRKSPRIRSWEKEAGTSAVRPGLPQGLAISL